MDVSEIKEQIITHPLFQKLKDVRENNPWHHNEVVYDHALKTFTVAQTSITAPFITDQEAKKGFETFIQTRIGELTRGEVMQLIALLHDIGKSLSYQDNGKTSYIVMIKPDGMTQCPGHDYWGSILLPEILRDLLPNQTIAYMAHIISIHDTFPDTYFAQRKDWPIELVVDDAKARGEGKYIECLFNIHCDNYHATVSTDARKRIEEVFNQLALYTERIYKIS